MSFHSGTSKTKQKHPKATRNKPKKNKKQQGTTTFCWLCCFGLLFWVCGHLFCFEPQMILRNQLIIQFPLQIERSTWRMGKKRFPPRFEKWLIKKASLLKAKKVVKTWRPKRDLPRQYTASHMCLEGSFSARLIRSSAHTLCDDLARAAGAKDGKKIEGSFSAPEIGRLFGDAVGPSLFDAFVDADVCSWITTTRLNREFKWDVKHAPREAPDSDC